MKRLKIAFFIDEYRPGAGTENQLMGILQNIDPAQADAKLFTLRKEIPDEYRKILPCPTACLHVGKLISIGGLIKYIKLVRRLRKEKFDIAMIYFVDSNLFVVPACSLAGVKNIIVNRRDLGYWYNPKILRILNRVNKKADYFLVNAEAVKKVVAEKENFPEERIKVIYNALWVKPGGGKKKISREELGIPTDAKVIGIIANLRPVKRVDRFLNIAKLINEKLPRTHFIILGGGELEVELKNQAGDIALNDSVHFMGAVSDIQSYLGIFDVGVLTSESEGLSNTLIEYCRAGVPAVAFDVGGNREVIKDNASGRLVPDDDIAGFADAVVGILADNEVYKRYSAAGRKIADELFSPERILGQLMEFYRTITANSEKSDK
jgi:glycosyltransferase involved in cell wall biosynthesis